MHVRHTPGPWAVMTNGATIRYVVQGPEGEPLAMTYGQEHQEGDARLFAEAPAMLDALRDARDHLSHFIGSSYCETNKEDEALLDRLDAILARIEECI